jgi:type I restriction enzyme S subunit
MNKGGRNMPLLRFPEFREAGVWDTPELREISMPVDERVGDRQLTPMSISAGIGFVPQVEKFGRDISGSQYRLYTLVRDGYFVYNKGNSLKFPQGCVYDLQGCGEAAVPNVFICFHLKFGYDNGFFRYCFENNTHGIQLKKHITSGVRSNGLLNISKDTFFGIKIPTPKYAEQQKIADCLSSIDELITAEARKLEVLKFHKKGLMQQLFPAEGETVPRLRFPEFREAGEWELKSLAEIADILNEKVGNRKLTLFSITPGVGLVSQVEKFGREIAGAQYKNYYVIRQNDFAYNKSSTKEYPEGFIAMYQGDKEGAVPGSIFTCFRVHASTICPPYLDYVFANNLHGKWLRRFITIGARAHGSLNVDDNDLLATPIPIPPEGVLLNEQQKIANCLSSIDELITLEAQKLEVLKSHKKGLMQQLFPMPDEKGGKDE